MKKIFPALLMALCWLLHSCTSSRTNQSYITLKQFDNIEAQKIATFVYQKETVKTEYLLELSGENKIVLRNLHTGIIEEEYQNRQASVSNYPDNSCAKQELQQWKSFQINILPGLVSQANRTCSAVRYCVGIYCNGQPRVFYLLLIPPTATNCIKVIDIKAEVGRYAF